ncbi:hypothetical protein B0H14DRAFT_2649207 [Mycena olivaceomarginata]|nr:hypothetical protein B0H14DRAFT_2649207 [Mycena olivaceomarginata]
MSPTRTPLQVVSSKDGEVLFRMRRDKKFKRLMATYAERIGKDVDNLQCHINGVPISAHDTPESLRLENYAIHKNRTATTTKSTQPTSGIHTSAVFALVVASLIRPEFPGVVRKRVEGRRENSTFRKNKGILGLTSRKGIGQLGVLAGPHRELVSRLDKPILTGLAVENVQRFRRYFLIWGRETPR